MALNYVSLLDDGVEERWYLDAGLYRRYVNESLVEERPFDASDAVWQTAIQALDGMESGSLLVKLRNALSTNRTYLEKVNAGTAVTADHIAQVPALTRQMTAVLLRTVLDTH